MTRVRAECIVRPHEVDLYRVLRSACAPHDDPDVGPAKSVTTLITTPLAIEGLTTDGSNLYTIGRGADGPCPVWQINLGAPSLVVVGLIPNPCSPSGVVFNSSRQLFTADGERIYTLTPSAASPPTATVFAPGVPGTNAIAFDRSGNAWTGDGTTGQGRVWRIDRQGSVTEVFRVPPIAIETTWPVASDAMCVRCRQVP